jgi:hypothetical protein
MRDIPVLEPVTDCTHDAGGDPTFQESSLIVWHDMTGGVGGVWRVSQEPVAGLTHSCFALFTHDGLRFRSNVQAVPFQRGDRGPNHMGLGSALRLNLDTMTIRADFPECEASLVFEDFHPRYDYLSLMNAKTPEGHAGKHVEVAGRVKGQVRIGDRGCQVNALGHRDRSWGPRRWETLLSTRWWPAVFGPDLCVWVLSQVHDHATHGCSGYIVRNDTVHLMTEADVAVTLDYDAIGPRAAHAHFVLETGEVVDLYHQRTSGVLLDVRGFRAVESIGTARWGERLGMSNIEVCTNPFAGTREPAVILEADHSQGLSRRGR